jgi:DNA topoisomerase VI subunit A
MSLGAPLTKLKDLDPHGYRWHIRGKIVYKSDKIIYRSGYYKTPKETFTMHLMDPDDVYEVYMIPHGTPFLNFFSTFSLSYGRSRRY